MTYLTFLLIIWLHFIADFIFQTDKMALNKSKRLEYLCLHCFVYSIPILIIGVKYAIINGVLHLAVDFVSSKVTAILWEQEERHIFFVVIGLDQAIHITCLILTFKFM